ncbi:MAG: hypothetical protein QM783_10265 [Phycisphaerales bacterium]
MPRTKDHVIARNFVPPGHFDGQWNLIVNACEKCNSTKSQLENEVAAISMQPDAWGRHPENDHQLASEAMRRAQSVKNSRTGKPLHIPEKPIVSEYDVMPGLRMTFSLVAPAQLSDDQAFRLAWHQIAAFFYLITYKPDLKLGRRWPGEFLPIAVVRESDWGNSLMRTFQDLVGPWDHRVHGIAASGYFGVCIKKSPAPRELWSWALEWNRTFRVIGFIGSQEAAQDAARSLVWPQMRIRQTGANSSESFRLEERMPEGEDKLFLPPSLLEA